MNHLFYFVAVKHHDIITNQHFIFLQNVFLLKWSQNTNVNTDSTLIYKTEKQVFGLCFLNSFYVRVGLKYSVNGSGNAENGDCLQIDLSAVKIPSFNFLPLQQWILNTFNNKINSDFVTTHKKQY